MKSFKPIAILTVLLTLIFAGAADAQRMSFEANSAHTGFVNGDVALESVGMGLYITESDAPVRAALQFGLTSNSKEGRYFSLGVDYETNLIDAAVQPVLIAGTNFIAGAHASGDPNVDLRQKEVGFTYSLGAGVKIGRTGGVTIGASVEHFVTPHRDHIYVNPLFAKVSL